MESLIQDILLYLELHREIVPRGYSLLDRESITDMPSALLFLETLFQAEEEAIQEEHTKAFFTDDYENGVRQFAIAILRILFPEYDMLKDNHVYRRLLTQRHMAYAYFHCLNNELFRPGTPSVPLDINRQIYSGLVDFYNNFHGNFSDNEEAIELLCKYFPLTLAQKADRQNLVSALYAHVSLAGAPGNKGFAYRGINLTEKWIANLSDSIALDILKQYKIFQITNDSVYRHQIHSIIKYSKIRNKTACKFRFLDSVLLLDRVSLYFLKGYTALHPDADFPDSLYSGSRAWQNITLCKNPPVYWDNGTQKRRTFYLNGNPAADICLTPAQVIRLTIRNTNFTPDKTVLSYPNTDWRRDFPYSDEDWRLEQYQTTDLGQALEGLISNAVYRHRMTFSMLYLDNYRGLHRQWIDFDHKFVYSDMEGIITQKPESDTSPEVSGFYGRYVHSLTCIVGKNGTGKTTIVDFLRESFFRLLRLIGDYGLPCKEGSVEEADYLDYNILDKGARFFIIFFMDDAPFFLTNTRDITCSCATPFQSGRYDSNDLSKVVYFSNMLKNNQESLFMVNQEQRSSDKIKQEKRDIGRSLSLFRQVDYSETGSFIKRQQHLEMTKKLFNIFEEPDPEKHINEELCYQLTFLKHTGKEKLCEYLDFTLDKEFKISSHLAMNLEDTFSLDDLGGRAKITELESKYCFLPDAQIQHFSSGQYAKFAFLSKLYWFLDGYQKEHKRYEKLAPKNSFPRENALQDGETALLFIDEGETYYHPEWQRRYISTLLEMINHKKRNSRLQIVLTTNSPFILSDILLEDAVYLDKKEDGPFDRTLGQNIHTLLKENFFMSYTIGEYARMFIEDIMLCLQNPEQPKEQEQADSTEKPRLRGTSLTKIRKLVRKYFGEDTDLYSALRHLIDQIGEPVYRYELEQLLEENAALKEQRQLEHLLEEKKRIEAEINRLQEKRFP